VSVSVPRILYVEGNVDGTVGGSYYSLFYLATGLNRKRFTPIVAFCADTPLRSTFESRGIETIVLTLAKPIVVRGFAGKLVSKFGNFLLGWIGEPMRLAALLRRKQIALVHLNNGIIKNHAWMLAARIARVPCVTHERGFNTNVTTRVRFLARGLGAVICISEAVRTNLVDRGLGGARLVTLHNGLDPMEMRVTRSVEEVREEVGLAHLSRLVGIVGNIRYWKGQEVVVRAMALLRVDFPDVGCVLIGNASQDEHGYRIELEQLIDLLGLKNSVVMTGYRSDIANYINALDIQVHASVDPEPFGRVLLEAMALSKPLVASAAGGVPEIVLHGVTGLLYEPGRAEALAECLARLLNDPAYANELGRNGYLRLVHQFSIHENVTRTERIYDGLLRVN